MTTELTQPNATLLVSRKTCGVVMPISSQPGCSAEHWADVRSIIEEAVQSIDDPKFDVRLVSDADDVGVIQKRIVQNVYSAEILVCDVSCKNPNVMFELGMRLAFDKPTVIIKDDQTDYSFDTGIIEHLTYPRDLRFNKITLFKKLLAEKVTATFKASTNPQHSTFLKNFGTFHVAQLSESIASTDRISLEMLGEIQADIGALKREFRRPLRRNPIVPERTDDAIKNARGHMLSLIQQYMKANKIEKTKNLLEDKNFETWLEEALPAPNYFSSFSAYREALVDTLAVLDV